MGIIDRFIDKRVQDKLGPIVKDFQVRLDQQKAMSFASLSNYGIRQAVYSSLRFDITNSDTLYAIIRKRYMKEAAVPLLVYKKKSERKADFNKYLTLTKGSQSGASFQKSIQYRVKALDEVTLDNDLARLLQRPSRTMGADSFWQGVYYQYALGECFIRKNRGGSLKGKPIERIPRPRRYSKGTAKSTRRSSTPRCTTRLAGWPKTRRTQTRTKAWSARSTSPTIRNMASMPTNWPMRLLPTATRACPT